MSNYQPRPMTGGYYWIRWRRKYMRSWFYDIAWCVRDHDHVRVEGTWRPVSEFPHATFCGPLVAPQPTEGSVTP